MNCKVTKEVEITNQTVKNHPYIKDCLIYDLETDSLDLENAKIKWISYFSYKDCKYHIIPPDQIQKFDQVLNEHRVLIGFNNQNFDNPILTNNGFDVEYKTVIDLLRVMWNPDYKKVNRKLIIKLPNGKSLADECKTNKLKDLCKALGFEVEKGEIDYKIFQKESWTLEEIKEIEIYALKDIMITRQLFEYVLEYFDAFKQFVPESNIRKFHYLKSSLGSYTYTVLCYMTGLEEKYNDKFVKDEKFKGAFVVEITKPEAHGTILLIDFASLYPNIFIQCNLYSPSINGWSGDNFFPVSQSYNDVIRGTIETVLYNILVKRLEWKRLKDPRELAFKIVLNTAYGLTGNPNFVQVCHGKNAEDCTQIGVTCIKYAHQVFKDNGFEILYGDTDSAFVYVPEGKTKEEALLLCDKIIKDLQAHMPFPSDTWKFVLDGEIKHIWFVNKKNYVYITNDNKLIIKGLPIMKSDASILGQKILEKLKPLIIERQSIKFDREFIEKLIDEEIKNDISVIAQVYSVRSPDDYKSHSSLQFQIAEKLGEGNHVLIPNKTLGDIGKTKKYLPASDVHMLSLGDLILEKPLSELEPFILQKYNKV